MTWLDQVVAVYGRPRIAHEEPYRMQDDAGNYHWRQSWVWFPGNINHHVLIREYRGSEPSLWKIEIGINARDRDRITYSTRITPLDFRILVLMDLVGFLHTPVTTKETNHDPTGTAPGSDIPGRPGDGV